MDALTPDGRRLRLHPAGADPSPERDLVVLEAGLGSSGRSWGPVQRLLPATLASMAYDRAGYGASDPAPGRRGLTELAADLDAVVASLPHRRLVVVGHSWGGPILRVWADGVLAGPRSGTDPERLTGLVLADPADERADLYFSRAYRLQARSQDALYPLLVRFGIMAPLARVALKGLPEPDLADTVAAVSSLRAAHAIVAENGITVEELAALRADPPQLGDLPIRVVSGTKRAFLARLTRDPLVAAHRQFVAEHAGATQVEAPNSEHLVPISDPGIVAAQVESLLG